MDDVQCFGNETSLAACGFAGFGSHDCDHSEDAGVICHSGNYHLKTNYFYYQFENLSIVLFKKGNKRTKVYNIIENVS